MKIVLSPSSEGDRNKLHNTAARTPVPENEAVNVIDAKLGYVTDCYQVTCEGRDNVSYTTDTGPQK